jgi:hypothetical protein
MSEHILLEGLDLEDVLSKRREIIKQWKGVIYQINWILNYVTAKMSQGVPAQTCNILNSYFQTPVNYVAATKVKQIK